MVVKVLIFSSCVAHSTDDLARGDRTTFHNILLVTVEKLVKIPTLISNGYPPYCTLPSVLHDAIDR